MYQLENIYVHSILTSRYTSCIEKFALNPLAADNFDIMAVLLREKH